jgi:hypothetical protein
LNIIDCIFNKKINLEKINYIFDIIL